jgi:hypothetical protein
LKWLDPPIILIIRGLFFIFLLLFHALPPVDVGQEDYIKSQKITPAGVSQRGREQSPVRPIDDENMKNRE